jgi:carbon starvation protein
MIYVSYSILLKMGRARWIWITLAPMAWLIATTMTASYQKIFDPSPRIGFLAQARVLAAQIASHEDQVRLAELPQLYE